MDPITKTDVHPFEKAGLGEAPFKFVRLEVSVGPIKLADGTHVGAPGQPMGTCDACGTGIMYCYTIADRNGKESIVGCECVKKLARTDNERRDPVIARILREERDLKRRQRHEREEAKIKEGFKIIEDNKEKLSQLPHPLAWAQEKKMTLLDYAEYMMTNFRVGNAGKLKTIKIVKSKLGIK